MQPIRVRRFRVMGEPCFKKGLAVKTQLASSESTGEQSLLQAGQQGESQALDTLFHRHRRMLFHSALRITGNWEDAEDALQEGLLCAFRSFKKFERRSQFSTWLTRIVINAALMRRRSLLSRPTAAALEPLEKNEIALKDRLISKDMTPEQLFRRAEILEMTQEHIDALSPVLRTVFVLRIVMEFTSRETAAILCIPPNTVKARLWRARRQLSQRVSRILFHRVPAFQADSARFAYSPAAGD